MPQTKTMRVADHLTVTVCGKCGTIDSTRHENGRLGAAIDGVESLLLALACEGVDVGSEQVRRAYQTVEDTITNQYGD